MFQFIYNHLGSISQLIFYIIVFNIIYGILLLSNKRYLKWQNQRKRHLHLVVD